jgi:glutamine amidotransferase
VKKVAIVNYGLCNLDSIERAVAYCGGNPVVTDQPGEITKASHIILPGVGAFRYAMENLHHLGLVDFLSEQVLEKRIPFLGICLGMQLLATKGYEGGDTQGLGWIAGEVRKFAPTAQQERIPHVGWNEVHYRQDSPLFANIASGKDFYFVHSYHFCCAKDENVLARTPYCGSFTSVVGRDLIFGVQFHAEKSQRLGFQVLKNFLAL